MHLTPLGTVVIIGSPGLRKDEVSGSRLRSDGIGP
jgi:hypothetical protein